MTVLAPGDEFECASMIRWATAFEGPVYLPLSREGGPALFNKA
jgi:transketolase C-terminal domain/subunit